MISEHDQDLIQEVGRMLNQGMKVPQVAEKLGLKPSTLYQRLYRLGYRIENRSQLRSIQTHGAA